MSRYKMDDGVIVDTAAATHSWNEATRFDGKNMISVATGSQWAHQALHRSRGGRYWLECWTDWQGSEAAAIWVSPEHAAGWLLLNLQPLPVDLVAAGEAVLQ